MPHFMGGHYRTSHDNLTSKIKQNKLQTLRDENSHLQALVCKLKALNTWKSTSKEGQLRQMLRNAEKEAVKNKKEGLKLKMIVDKEVSLLRQQLSVARTALARTQAENVKVQQQLDKQKQLMNESEHKYSQEIRSREQLDRIKSASMDRLLENMEEKEHRLRSLAEEAERSSKMGHMQQSKIKKEVKQIKCQLMQERSLKLDAFQRVDELQTQVYDLETPSLGNSPTVLRKKSASLLSRCARSATTVSSSWTTAPVNMDPEAFGEYLQYYSPAEIKESDQVERRIQRPKTVPSRCRHKMTAELTPSTSQTILTQLQELRLKTK